MDEKKEVVCPCKVNISFQAYLVRLPWLIMEELLVRSWINVDRVSLGIIRKYRDHVTIEIRIHSNESSLDPQHQLGAIRLNYPYSLAGNRISFSSILKTPPVTAMAVRLLESRLENLHFADENEPNNEGMGHYKPKVRSAIALRR